MIRPRTHTERAIFDLWSDLRPEDAFGQGIDACAGRFNVPTSAAETRFLRRIDRLTRMAEDETQERILASWRMRLELREPCEAPTAVMDAFFAHAMKGALRPRHVASLANAGRRALHLAARRARAKVSPPGMRALVQLACDGLRVMLRSVGKTSQPGDAQQALANLRRSTDRYAARFDLPGFAPGANFAETFAVLRKNGSRLGRSKRYARALRDLWDYRETPSEVESAGLRMIRAELGSFQRVVEDLARDLGCHATGEAVENLLRSTRGLPPGRVLPFLRALRGRALPVAEKHLVRINPGYAMEILETPEYLVNTTPAGAAYSLDTFTDHPKDIFLVTTDSSAGRQTPAELLSLLVHEEYGHCVHGSNAGTGYAARPGVLDLLNGPSVCVSEGLAFQMESDFLPILGGIAARSMTGDEERAFADFFDAVGGVETVAREYEFHTLLGRITRFLRVVGDARINSGKQDLVDFLEWAHRRTGLARATVYYAVFPAHQALGPGYATTYAIIGESIRRIQGEALRRGKSLPDFNAYATSIGWPPRSVFEKRLDAWARA